MKRALVIGGTGFVGLNLVDALLNTGVAVRCTRRRRSITAYLRQRQVEFVEAELFDADSLRRAMIGCEVVFYAAAPYPRYSFDVAGEARAACDAADSVVTAAKQAGIRRLVYTGSTGLLESSASGRSLDERDVPPTMPIDSVYRASKWATHQRMLQARDQGLEVSGILAGGCIGPWDVRAGTGGLLLATMTASLPWYVDGWVHLVDVRDVARAHLAAARCDVPPRDYCVPGNTRRLATVIHQVVACFGGRVPPIVLDSAQARAQADMEERSAVADRKRVPFPREFVDIVVAGRPIDDESSRRVLGLTLGPLNAALADARDWFVRHGYLPQLRSAAKENKTCLIARPATFASSS